jgi:hypothetical protein
MYRLSHLNSLFSRFLGVVAFSAVGNSSFCNGHGLGFGGGPMPSDGCCSIIYPTINRYRVGRRNMESFGGLFGLVLGHGCHDLSLVHFLYSNYHIPSHFCLSVSSQTLQNIRVWLLEGACSVTSRFGWLFIGRFLIYRGILGTTNWATTKKLLSLKIEIQFTRYLKQRCLPWCTRGVGIV